MNFVSWLLALSILVIVFIESIYFHQATVCRQLAWKMGVESITRTLLTDFKAQEQSFHSDCKILLVRSQQKVKWQKRPSFKLFSFEMAIEGGL
jgi:hypothetical protein